MMKRPIVAHALGIVANAAAAFAVLLLLLARQQWFGSGDAEVFLYWTLPLAVGIAVLSPVIFWLLSSFSATVKRLLLAAAAPLLALGWTFLVASLLGSWMGAFSFPVLYPWVAAVAAQLLWLEHFLPKPQSRPQVLRMLGGGLLGAGGLAVAMVAVVLSVAYFNRPAKETYLIPEDFTGNFRVVYGEEGGLIPPVENGRRLLRLPGNGVLVVQPPAVGGEVDNEYYWVDKQGRRKRAPEVVAISGSQPGPAGVAFVGSGSMGESVASEAASEAEPDVRYNDFTVSTNSTATVTEAEYSRRTQQLDSLTLALVRACRSQRP